MTIDAFKKTLKELIVEYGKDNSFSHMTISVLPFGMTSHDDKASGYTIEIDQKTGC